MFDVGKTYEIEIIEAPGDRSFVYGKALEVNGALIKLQTDKGVRVFNAAAYSCASVAEHRELSSGSIYQPPKSPSSVYLDDEPTA